MKTIVHIAPTLPPVVNGLGDFCKILADNLQNEGNVKNLFFIRNASGTRVQPDTYIFNRHNIAAKVNLIPHNPADPLPYQPSDEQFADLGESRGRRSKR